MGAQPHPGWAVEALWTTKDGIQSMGGTVMVVVGSRDPWVSWKEGGAWGPQEDRPALGGIQTPEQQALDTRA